MKFLHDTYGHWSSIIFFEFIVAAAAVAVSIDTQQSQGVEFHRLISFLQANESVVCVRACVAFGIDLLVAKTSNIDKNEQSSS